LEKYNTLEIPQLLDEFFNSQMTTDLSLSVTSAFIPGFIARSVQEREERNGWEEKEKKKYPKSLVRSFMPRHLTEAVTRQGIRRLNWERPDIVIHFFFSLPTPSPPTNSCPGCVSESISIF
jgi:hypothetical protein